MPLRDALHRLAASREELEAADELAICRAHGATPVAEVQPRRPARVYGVVSALTYRPRGQAPALVARLYDGSGTMDLIFLGRHEVPGIEPGRRLLAEGMVLDDRGRLAIFNPAYRLSPPGGQQ
ncbi:OB-fold nucleic acid binding domain-containing protein [Georgenia sp. TF02-10]|uniref:OB-fold nucleic acid binding domain-containing protein n=1 Tax=Georgenia sp. TF02-10 TaxID=2917725 RepID=UPI001FA7CAD0|nr:OB-fold nucleic acid binding domain-containing protein [Georgenia sp. TF02-10]UNX53381.1 OB-fold nucleic acid binding domain-containing protein [Georgenia sp. TF02-10]